MKAASVNEIKQELQAQHSDKLVELCLRLARFKKENKELLTYLLFEAHNQTDYITSVKKEMDSQFTSVNQSNVYFAKKTIRKVLRTANKFIRYSSSAVVETELLLHFCFLLQSLGPSFMRNTIIKNIYQGQLKKIDKAINGLHEDLQYDYVKQVAVLTENEW
ncbi:MAG: hypothetical protein SFU21_15205 [Flavihumibacter sp.]|nr:hypothetical protein [Flavihumibacter sp.]